VPGRDQIVAEDRVVGALGKGSVHAVVLGVTDVEVDLGEALGAGHVDVERAGRVVGDGDGVEVLEHLLAGGLPGRSLCPVGGEGHGARPVPAGAHRDVRLPVTAGYQGASAELARRHIGVAVEREAAGVRVVLAGGRGRLIAGVAPCVRVPAGRLRGGRAYRRHGQRGGTGAHKGPQGGATCC
jgi:hypothetical protein